MFARARHAQSLQTSKGNVARTKDMVAHATIEICMCKIFWPRVPKRIILLSFHGKNTNIEKVILAIIVPYITLILRTILVKIVGDITP